MEKTKKVLLVTLLLIFSVVMGGCTSPKKTRSIPVTKQVPDTTKKMYLKSGRSIECDVVWEGMGSQILCKKSGDIIAYSAGDVDLIKTFGQSSATEMAKRYEQRVKHREFMSRPMIVTPAEQERNMRRTERERLELEKKYPKLIARIDLEKRWLKDKLKGYKDKYSEASRPPTVPKELYSSYPSAAELRSRHVQGTTREEVRARLKAKLWIEKERQMYFYKSKIEDIENKIEELERDPVLYFYKINR